MFEKFGEFNSAEELNRKAEELKGDIDKLKQFAAENGLEEDDVNDYVDGVITELATPLTAAMGKIKAEKEELELHGVLEDWYEAVADECMSNLAMAVAVRENGKNLAVFMSRLLAKAFQGKVRVSDKIVSITTIEHDGKQEQMRGPVYLGIPSRAEVKKMMREYYLGRERA